MVEDGVVSGDDNGVDRRSWCWVMTVLVVMMLNSGTGYRCGRAQSVYVAEWSLFRRMTVAKVVVVTVVVADSGGV